MTIITNNKTTTVVHPSKTALNFPTLTILAAKLEWTAPFRCFGNTALKSRDGWLNTIAEPEQAIVPYYTGKLIDFKPSQYRW
jgi:hypothetical protein